MNKQRDRQASMSTPTWAPHGDIHLGDLARALGSLHWRDPAQAEVIAACLGFGLAPDSAPARPRQAPREVYNRSVPPSPAEVERQPTTTAPTPVPIPPTPLAPPPLPRRLSENGLSYCANAGPASFPVHFR